MPIYGHIDYAAKYFKITEKSRKTRNFFLPAYIRFQGLYEHEQNFFQLQFLRHHDLKKKYFSSHTSEKVFHQTFLDIDMIYKRPRYMF